MSSSPDVDKRSRDLGNQIAAICQNQPSDVIMNALLSGIVTVIRDCHPKDQQREVAAQFAVAVVTYVADPPEKRGTMQ